MPLVDQRLRNKVGTILDGAYKLTRLVGEGGMSAVYEATHLRLHKRVAVKLMIPDLAANAVALERFRREVEVTAQLAHPHIVQMSDFGSSAEGAPFLVLEFLEGEDLEQRMRRVGRLAPADALAVVRQVASALAATHARGIVHRDLKPANVFLISMEGVSDFVKVLDFGISKVKTSKVSLTRASVMMGTPNYMAPEQAAGRIDDVDHRTDQWALAGITWEMLSGRVPFVGTDLTTLLFNIVHQDPPSLAERVAGLPPEVEPVLRRALSKRPSDRFATVAAFARALEAAITPAPIPVPVKTPPPPAPEPPWRRAEVAAAARRTGAWLRGLGETVFRKREAPARRRTLAFATLAKAVDPRALWRSLRPAPKPKRKALPWLLGVGGALALGVAGMVFARPAWLFTAPHLARPATAIPAASARAQVVPLGPRTAAATAREKGPGKRGAARVKRSAKHDDSVAEK
jgi:serine/threonine-protein kinase